MPAFDRHFESLMKRLKSAGWIESYDATRTPCVIWSKASPSAQPGRRAFLSLAALLQDICPERPLSDDEQALIQMMAALETEDPSPQT